MKAVLSHNTSQRMVRAPRGIGSHVFYETATRRLHGTH